MLTILGIDIVLLVALLIIGIPLPYCFGGAVLFITILGDIPIKGLMLWGFNQMISPVLIAGPLFILAGTLISESGIADRLIDAAKVFIGRLRGSLGVLAIVTCGFLGAISGSAFTGIAAVGPALLPKMLEEGYPRGYATALISSATILGILIPPSVTMIIYGWVTGTSVLAAFLSTVGPGILLMIMLSVINIIDSKRFPMPEAKAAIIAKEINETQAEKSLRIKTVFRNAIPGLMMPVIILGGIYGGIFTPTEAASVAAIVALIIGVFIYKKLTRKNLLATVKKTATSVGAIMTMIFFCLILSQTFVMLQLPQQLVAYCTSLTQNKLLILLVINVFLFFVGMIVNDTTAIILCAPLLLPLVTKFGVSPTQFAAIMCVNLGVGGLTPPYASVLYLGMRVCDCSFSDIIKPAYRFILLAFLPVMIVTTYWPPLTEFLPKLLGY